MDRRVADKSQSRKASEIYKEQALAAFARAEEADTEEVRAQLLQIAVEWLKLATEAANLWEKSPTSDKE